MLDKIISFSLRQRPLMLIFILFILGIGIYSTVTLPIDAFPDVSNIQVEIISKAPGRSPLEMEKFVTYPVEIAMRGLPKLVQLRSISKFGISIITVIFEDDVDIYFARQLVLERLIEVKESLPEGVETSLGPVATAMGEVYQYTLEGEEPIQEKDKIEYLTELRTIQDWVVGPLLKNIPGVNEVDSFGGYIKQYHVCIDPDLLVKYDLSLQNVFQAVKDNNCNVGGGFLEQGSEQYLIRGIGLLKSVSDIENIALKSHESTAVFIKDVAQVKIGQAVRQGASLKDGKKEVVGGIVMMLRGSNGRVVVNKIKKKVAEINKGNLLPKGIKINPYYDRAELIHSCIKTTTKALQEGGILVIVILFLFLGSLRTAMVVVATLPLVSLLTFTIMKLPQVALTANLMTLGGLAIAIGMVVDGSVVVVENIQRHLSKKQPADILHAIATSVKEVGRPVVFGIMIIAIVFLPLFSFEGMERKMFTPLAITIIIALLSSLFVSLTISPVLCSWFLKAGKEEDTIILKFLKKLYLPFLTWALSNRKKVVLAAVGIFILIFPLIFFLGAEFIPIMDEGAFDMDTRLLAGVSLPDSLRVSKKVEKILKQFPELEIVIGRIGWTGIGIGARGVESTGYTGIFKPKKQWKTARSKEEMIDKMRKALSKIPGMAFSFSQPIQCRIDELIAGTRTQIVIKLFGEDLEILQKKANQIAEEISAVRGVADLMVDQLGGQPYISINIDRQKIALYGINVENVQNIIETAIGGNPAGRMYEGEKYFEILVRFTQENRNSVEVIGNSLVDVPGQELKIPLKQLADISVVDGPVQIGREYGQRLILIQCNVNGRDIGSFVAECQKKIKEKSLLSPGYYLTWGGQFENQQRAMKKLLIIVPITIVLIFLLLFFTFNSLRQAVLIILNLPFALIGGIFALFISKLYLSVPSSVGFIALFGIAVLNGVVLISYINQLRERGFSLGEAIFLGCECRLRPILMTAMITVFSLVPLLFATGPGSEVQRPLAVVVVGGLITSTLLTLFVLPVLYSKFEEKKPEMEF